MLVFEGNEEDLEHWTRKVFDYSKQSFITPSRSCLDDGSVENDRNHGGVVPEVSEGNEVSISRQSRGIHVIF